MFAEMNCPGPGQSCEASSFCSDSPQVTPGRVFLIQEQVGRWAQTWGWAQGRQGLLGFFWSGEHSFLKRKTQRHGELLPVPSVCSAQQGEVGWNLNPLTFPPIKEQGHLAVTMVQRTSSEGQGHRGHVRQVHTPGSFQGLRGFV